MTIPIIENIDKKINGLVIDKLSPSQFSHLVNGCRYQFLLNKITKELPQYKPPMLPQTLLGIIIHKIIELRFSGEIKNKEDFEVKWKTLVEQQEIEAYGIDSGIYISDWKKFYQTQRYILSIPQAPLDRTKSKTTELGIWDIEYLHGVIDKINFSENKIEIIDFKTGDILDENGDIKQTYVIQLKLYALLYQLKHKRDINKLSLVSLDGKNTDVKFSQEEIRKLYQQVKKEIALLNTDDKEKLLSQDMKLCSRCTERHLCTYYWNGELAPTDISGKVHTVNEYGLISLSSGESKIHISHLSCYSKEALHNLINQNVRIINLCIPKKIKDGKLFKGRNWSRIYVVK